MKKVAVLFHDGFEEVEALSVVDIMRRANVECTMVGMDKLLALIKLKLKWTKSMMG